MRKIMCITVFAILMAAGIHAASANVLAVLSFDNTVYRTALKGFEKGAESKGLSLNTTEFVMKGDSQLPVGNNDIVLAIGTKAFETAKTQAKGKKIIFLMVFVDEKSHDGNSSGVTLAIPAASKIEKIKEFVPGSSKLGVIYTDASVDSFKEINSSAAAKGYTVVAQKVSGPDSFDGIFDGMKDGIDSYLMLPDSKLYVSKVVKSLLSKSLSYEVPVIGLSSIYTRAGAYIALDYDYSDLGIQSGELAADIISGKKSGAIIHPRKVKISINSTVAKSMKLGSMIGKADEVFGR